MLMSDISSHRETNLQTKILISIHKQKLHRNRLLVFWHDWFSRCTQWTVRDDHNWLLDGPRGYPFTIAEHRSLLDASMYYKHVTYIVIMLQIVKYKQYKMMNEKHHSYRVYNLSKRVFQINMTESRRNYLNSMSLFAILKFMLSQMNSYWILKKTSRVSASISFKLWSSKLELWFAQVESIKIDFEDNVY